MGKWSYDNPKKVEIGVHLVKKGFHKIKDPEALVFVKTDPVWAGKAKEIPDIVDKKFWYMLEKWRWWKLGTFKISGETNATEALSIRAIQENIDG